MATTSIVYIYQSSVNLPREGWLQACNVCNEVTSNTFDVIEVNVVELTPIRYVSYLCCKCEAKLTNNHSNSHLIYRTKNKFFRSMNRTIISHLQRHNICKYSIENVANTSYNHTQLTHILRQRYYLPVEPKPPAPLAVPSNSSTNSTRQNGDKSGVQI